MSTLMHENDLTEQHYATLILRLMLDRRGRLVYGDMVDVTSTRQEHFVGGHGLIQAVQAWLAQQEKERALSDPPS